MRTFTGEPSASYRIRPGSPGWAVSVPAGSDGYCPISLIARNAEVRYQCATSRAPKVRSPITAASVKAASPLRSNGFDDRATSAVVRFCAQSPLYEVLTRGDDKESQAARDEAGAERERLAAFEAQAV